MKTYFIEGDIYQTYAKSDPDYTLIVCHADSDWTKGSFGAMSWWIPIPFAETGIKIMNRKRCSSLEEAEKLAKEHFNNYIEFCSSKIFSSEFLPDVFGPCVLKHKGEWIRGGSVSRKGVNKKFAFYPGLEMRIYERPREIPSQVIDEVRSSFAKDGYILHEKDTFRYTNIGRDFDSHRWVVLDITDQNQVKVL